MQSSGTVVLANDSSSGAFSQPVGAPRGTWQGAGALGREELPAAAIVPGQVQHSVLLLTEATCCSWVGAALGLPLTPGKL